MKSNGPMVQQVVESDPILTHSTASAHCGLSPMGKWKAILIGDKANIESPSTSYG